MDVDLGSLATSVTEKGIKAFGEEVWKRHVETVRGLWDSLAMYFETLEVSGLKVYQDGLVADGNMGKKIVEEGLKSGSKNYEIIYSLIQKGAVLMKTEDILLAKKERDRLLEMSRAKTRMGKLIAFLRYRLLKNRLLRKRDRCIARRINGTLNQGETGILFIGAYHNIIPLLDKDILVKEIKDLEKTKDYQRTFLHWKKDRERFEALSMYLISPVNI